MALRAVLRADASSTVGSGHLSRCLTLGRALAERQFAVDVVTRSPSDSVRAWIAREGHRLVPIGKDDLEETRRAVVGASIVVVDSYALDADYHDALREPGRVVCVIDDRAAARVGGDMIVNGNLYGDELTYETRAGARLLLGPAYALVRDEFARARAARVRRDEGKRVLVTMGGADPTHETERVIAALAAIGEPLQVRVVVGGANPRAMAVRSAATSLRQHEVEVFVDIASMGEQMAWCDLAVSAAGSTCLELACTGVSALLVVVADNQRLVGLAAAKLGLAVLLGESESLTTAAIASAVRELLGDRARRERMEQRAREAVDGLGKDRVVQALVDALR